MCVTTPQGEIGVPGERGDAGPRGVAVSTTKPAPDAE